MRYYKKIVGERVYLSPVNIDDAEICTAWLSDIEITRFLSNTGKILTIEAEQSALQSISADNFAIVTEDGDVPIGICGFIGMNESQRYSEVGIFVGNRDYLGNGYGTEAMSLLLDFGFNVRNLHSIRLRVRSFNTRAIKSYEKCGFKLAGHFRDGGRINGEYFDVILMDVLEDEFRAMKRVTR